MMQTVGRKRLLLYSVVAMGSLSALLAYGLDGGHQGISAFAIVAFIVRIHLPIPSQMDIRVDH